MIMLTVNCCGVTQEKKKTKKSMLFYRRKIVEISMLAKILAAHCIKNKDANLQNYLL